MTLDRRRFLTGTVAGAGLTLLGCGSRKQPAPVAQPEPPPPPIDAAGPPPKSLLVLGGTGFLGPHVVEAARARGFTLTLFNRGRTNPHLFPDVEKLQGNRDGDLKALEGRKWTAVVDTSGYVPRVVKASAELLAPNTEAYVFISTVSVYANEAQVGQDENAPLATTPDPTTEDVPKHYGALKALCEQAAERAMPGRVCNIRPGLIVGPGDPTGRFTHWVTRTADGGEVLAPAPGTNPTQYIDARDLAAWIVKVIEDRTTGIYNALGPTPPVTLKDVIDTCNELGGNKATITWVDPKFLTEQKVEPWQELPMWIPPEGDMAGAGTTSNARAVAKGLTFRPLRDTCADTLTWINGLPADHPKRERFRSSGITKERETAVLAAWKAKLAPPPTKPPKKKRRK